MRNIYVLGIFAVITTILVFSEFRIPGSVAAEVRPRVVDGRSLRSVAYATTRSARTLEQLLQVAKVTQEDFSVVQNFREPWVVNLRGTRHRKGAPPRMTDQILVLRLEYLDGQCEFKTIHLNTRMVDRGITVSLP